MINTDEVTDLMATALTGAVRLTWGVSSTAYLQGFVVVVTQNGQPLNVPRVNVPATSREVTVAVPAGTGYSFNVEAIVAQGGKVVACDPLPAEPTPEPPKPPAVTFTPGMNSGTEAEDFAALATLGVKLVRTEVAYSELSRAGSVIELFAAKGISVQLLVSGTPTTAQAQALGPLAAKYGPASGFSHPVHAIELGNEDSYAYKSGEPSSAGYKAIARNYALRAKESAEACAPHGVGVLIQASDGGTGSSVWVDEMFATVPDLASFAAGWTIHPYSGQQVESQTDSFGIPMMERMVADLAKHGNATTPIDVTEWGFTSNNGETLSDGKHYTFAEAAVMAEQHLAKLKVAAGAHPLHSFMVYQDRNQTEGTNNRECYFGALTHMGGPKGQYTTFIEQLLTT
jgi:hypothetical protein